MAEVAKTVQTAKKPGKYETELALCQKYGGDVDRYRRLSFDAYQLEQIRLGLEHSVDVESYTDPKLSWFEMEQQRKALESGIDITPYQQEGFDWMQMNEIQEGLKAGLDVNKYAKIEFLAPQMKELRLGLKGGLDVSLYAKPELDSFQMREVRSGMERGVSMVAYASPRLKPYTIRALALGKEHNIDGMVAVAKGHQGKVVLEYVKGRMEGIDLMEYLDRGFDADQLEVLREANKKNINLGPYLGFNLYGVQLREVMAGLEAGVNVSAMVGGGFNWMQMQVIRETLEKKLDPKPMLNRDFTPDQMREIRIGIEKGIDTTSFAKPGLEPEQMAKLRDTTVKESGLEDKINEILAGSAVSDLLTMDDLPELDFDIASEAEKLLEQEEVVDPAVALAKELVGNISKEIEEAEEIEEEIKKDIHITVSDDKMKAYINITQPIREGTVGVREIMRAVREQDIKQGIKNEEIQKIVDEQMFFMDVLIAEGKPGVNGEDGYFDFKFRREVKAKPKLLANGSVDYKGMELFETVEKDQVIAEYHPATAGEFGYDVYGNIVTPERGKELPELKGIGFHVSEDKKQYISDCKGIIEIDDEDKIEIRNVYNVPGDLDLATGNINFDGDVNIMGNVEAGFMITASGNVVIEGSVEGSSIYCGQDVLIKGGCQGQGVAEIKAGGNIVGQFFESSTLTAEGDITCTYLLSCDVTTESFLHVAGRRGVIIGGHVTAKTGLECFGIGNMAGTKTIIEVGVGDGDTKAYQELMDRCSKVEEDIKTLESGIEKIMAMEERDEKVEEFYDQLTKALYTQKNEITGLLEERERSIIKMTKQRSAQVEVKGTVHPQTRIFISSVVYTVRQTLKNVVFLKQDGKVGYKIRTKID